MKRKVITRIKVRAAAALAALMMTVMFGTLAYGASGLSWKDDTSYVIRVLADGSSAGFVSPTMSPAQNFKTRITYDVIGVINEGDIIFRMNKKGWLGWSSIDIGNNATKHITTGMNGKSYSIDISEQRGDETYRYAVAPSPDGVNVILKNINGYLTYVN